jgi:hypothetical protein
MKKSVLIILIILSLCLVVFATSKYYFKSDSLVATYDGFKITKDVLEKYVEDTQLPKKYQKMLKSKDGLKQLADYYMIRQMILDYAKKNKYDESHFVKQHMMSENNNKDMVMISAVLTKEINDKITVLPEEIDKYLKKNNSNDRRDAYFAIMSIKRQKRYDEFVKELRSKHKITYEIQ